MWREHRHDAIYGLGRVESVKRGQDEMARFGGHQSGFYGLVVSHLADQDHIGVLTKRAAERVREALGVHIDFSLIDVAFLIPMQKLNRIFDGHYVAGSGPVYVVNHRGQRRRLSRARGSGHEDQSASFIGDFFDDRWQAKLLNGPDGRRNDAKDNADGAALLEHIAPEASQARNAVGDVYLGVFTESLLLP